jgi:non-heme chloroperoxidase
VRIHLHEQTPSEQLSAAPKCSGLLFAPPYLRRRYAVCSGFEIARMVEIGNVSDRQKNKFVLRIQCVTIARMSTITTKDDVEIFYKDWGKGQPIVFSHGWPLSADDWDTQMLFFLGKGFRVIAHDRRGHGRSTQTGGGHDMDHYADDLAALTEHLDLKDAVHVGHSTGGGEVVHYLARHGESRVAKAVIISAVPPLMVKTAANPGGLPKEVFDGFQEQLAANRAQFYYDVPAGPFYGYNRPGAKPSQGVIWNWWRQGMMGGTKAHYDGIVAFSQTDFTEDLKKITVPVLVMHGDDDQIVPYADSAPLSAKLLKNSTLKTYKGFPHGMPTTEADAINTDLLNFLKA